MKVMIVNTLYSPYKVGGAEVSTQLLAETLVEKGHQVRVVTLTKENKRTQSVINGVEVAYLPLKNLYWPFSANTEPAWKRLCWHLLDLYNPFMVKQVEKELQEFRPEIVHTSNLAGFSVAVWSMVKRYSLPLIHTMRDYYLFHPNCTLFKGGKDIPIVAKSVQCWSWLKRRFSKHVDVAIGISHYISDLHQSGGMFSSAEHKVIYNPVPAPQVKLNSIKPLSVGIIGRLTTEKGFDEFCDIAERYSRKNIRFVAAGRFANGLLGEALKSRAEKADIELLGFVPLESFLAEVDVVILPVKWEEPFGRTVVECALAGKQVFASAKGGITELIPYFSNVQNISELERYLEGLDEDSLVPLTEVSQSERSNFSLSNIADQYIDSYR
ncbi:glycosyltransferase family 4 protein [Vibrio sp. S4M6]|uniref:glycosyltransferase family 4 protein n=1 Tax=Vibrio sinus TaxID=2946865 RepID=UPI00202A6B17|nr:glycosyltransferase family 4 protein [Vibrio sinus]MCL9781310.1 glycosyltransferase family 4 protein [Vibrio sinus]